MKSTTALLALVSSANAFFRMPCQQNLVTERIDPLIAPGAVSGHVHQVSGGNGFGFTTSFADTQKSTCTTCEAVADKSNYWTPILYYKDKQGQFTKVGQNGMTVYYLQRGDTANVTAFPEGFRMIAGDPFKRTPTNDFASQAVSFVCLNYNGGGPPEGPLLPNAACPNGLRAQVFFPACWDGVNLDSPDHKSHVSYYESGAYNTGVCPKSHPVQLISIFFEVVFDTAKFDFWAGDYGTNQPFVFAQGDPTGAGFHGDFINGWDVSVLSQAVKECTNDSGRMEDCAPLKLQSGPDMAKCTIPATVNEDITGPFAKLPGCNPVTPGPGPASPVTNCDVVAKIDAPKVPFTDVASKNWAFQGCATDDVNGRTLTGSSNIYSTNQGATTIETCIQACTGYQYMGLEYGKQCFCGNSVATDRLPQASTLGSCNLPCAGNSSQICGGPAQLSLYKACPAGTTCTNAGGYAAIGNLIGAGSSASAVVPAASPSAPAPVAASSAPAPAAPSAAPSPAVPPAPGPAASPGAPAAAPTPAAPSAGVNSTAAANAYGVPPTSTSTSTADKVAAVATTSSAALVTSVVTGADGVKTTYVTATTIVYTTTYITVQGSSTPVAAAAAGATKAPKRKHKAAHRAAARHAHKREHMRR